MTIKSLNYILGYIYSKLTVCYLFKTFYSLYIKLSFYNNYKVELDNRKYNYLWSLCREC